MTYAGHTIVTNFQVVIRNEAVKLLIHNKKNGGELHGGPSVNHKSRKEEETSRSSYPFQLKAGISG